MTQHSPSTCSPQPGDKVCWNCKTTQSPLWRKFSPIAETPDMCTPSTPSTTYLCNKCGLFYKRNKKQRPLELDGVSSGGDSPSIISSPKKRKSQSTTSVATTPKRKQSASAPELPTNIPSALPSPKVEEKKKRKRTTTNASVTSLPTSISALVKDNLPSSQPINSPVPQQTLSNNQYLPQPAKRRLLSPPENISTQPILENLYSTTTINTNTTCNIITNNNAPVVGICSEDLDALISEPSKKSKQTNNTTYRGFGSPIISSYSSNATFNTTPTPATTFNAPLTYSDASTLAQIFSMYFQQPQTVNYTTPSTHLYNTFAFGNMTTESTNNTYPNHIVDWYTNENEACTINPFGDADFLNNDQFLSEQDLFGEEPNKM